MLLFFFLTVIYRFKNHVFCDAQHGFDLPKSLAVSSVAVRILHTHYDHVSPLWLQCQSVPKLEALDSQELIQHSKDSVEEPEEEAKNAGEEPTMPAAEEMCSDGRKVGKKISPKDILPFYCCSKPSRSVTAY